MIIDKADQTISEHASTGPVQTAQETRSQAGATQPAPTLLDLPERELLSVGDDAYNSDTTAVRKTWLDVIDEGSPAHLLAYLRGEIESTRALDFGQLAHCFVLEPDLVHERYYREPPGDRRTTRVKELVAQARAENPGKRGFKPDEFDLGLKVRDAVYKHRGARIVLEADGSFEQAILWTNTATGEKCKARYDKTSLSKAFHADLKTCVSAHPREFAKAMVNNRYTMQATHYTEPTGLRFVFIAVEKTPPYAVAVYAVSDEILQHGQRVRTPLLRTYAECRASGRWPAYPETIQHIRLPRWAQ